MGALRMRQAPPPLPLPIRKGRMGRRASPVAFNSISPAPARNSADISRSPPTLSPVNCRIVLRVAGPIIFSRLCLLLRGGFSRKSRQVFIQIVGSDLVGAEYQPLPLRIGNPASFEVPPDDVVGIPEQGI